MAENPVDNTPPEQEVQKILAKSVLIGLVALLLLVLSFSYFVWRQNREQGSLLIQLSEQNKGSKNFENFFNGFINDLTAYSQQHPEILQMLVQSGIEVQQQAKQGKREIPPLPAPPAPPSQ